VAVKDLAPAACAPIAADRALCSLSTGINSVSTSPLAAKEEKMKGISVDGVIGKADMTSGLICRMALATASLPDNLSLIDIYLSPIFISIAPDGQTLAQMPQPLQCAKSKSALL
jgi:hypothetical protein